MKNLLPITLTAILAVFFSYTFSLGWVTHHAYNDDAIIKSYPTLSLLMGDKSNLQGTHPWLAEEAFNLFYSLNKSKLIKLGIDINKCEIDNNPIECDKINQIKNWIKEGAIAEDYDFEGTGGILTKPLLDCDVNYGNLSREKTLDDFEITLKDLVDVFQAKVSCEDLNNSVFSKRCGNHYYGTDGSKFRDPSLLGIFEKSAAMNARDWAIYGDFGSRSWVGKNIESANNSDELPGLNKVSIVNGLRYAEKPGIEDGFTWKVLGHALHLLCDMAVPAHVRNDNHIYPKDILEKFALNQTPGGGNINIINENSRALGPINKTSFEAYFDDLSSETRSNFYSQRTILQDTHNGVSLPEPNAQRLILRKQVGGDILGIDIFSIYGLYIKDSHQIAYMVNSQPITCSLLYRDENEIPLTKIEDYGCTWSNLYLRREHWVDRATAAIRHSAGFINNYVDQLIEIQQKNPPIAVITKPDKKPNTNEAELPINTFISFEGHAEESTPLYYEWNFGDLSLSDLQNPNHIYTTKGVYYATLKVTDIYYKIGTTQITIKIYDPNDKPAIPTGLSVTYQAANKNIITWNSVTSATSYNLYWSTNTGITKTSQVKTNVTSPYADTGLQAGSCYYYKATAVNSYGESDLSEEKSACVPNAPPPPVNQAPVASISSPANPSTYLQGANISFQGTGTDPEDGALIGNSLVWSSSLDGQIGSGTSFTKNNLSVGTHSITLTATDSQGLTGTYQVSVTVNSPSNSSPTAGISSPANGATFLEGVSITFTGSGNDPEDGNLTGNSLTWQSSISGVIGTGTSFSLSNLPAGTHVITLTATDSQNATGSAQVTITINSASGPTVNISSPTGGTSFTQGDTITFTGSATDAWSNPLSGASLVWTSSLNGQIGTGTSFTRNDLSNGSHTITLTATDSHGHVGTAQITILILDSTVLFFDDFNDGDDNGWTKTGTWQVVNGEYFSVLNGCDLQMSAKAGQTTWDNYIFQFDAKRVQGVDAIQVRFRNNMDETNNYAVHFRSGWGGDSGHNYVFFQKSGSGELARTEFTVNLNVWYTVKIVCNGNNIKIYVKEKAATDFILLFDYTDNNNPNLTGNITLVAHSGGCCVNEVHYDNVLVQKIDSFTNSIGQTFNLLPAGTFTMGSPVDEPGRFEQETQHQVTLTKPFYMMTTAVTQGQWRTVMGNNPSSFASCGDDCPVETVSWDEAQAFITALNVREGTTKYRLPTEAEREYAARAGSTTAFPTGDITNIECTPLDPNLDLIGWYCGNAGGTTHPVARKQANAWGLYDMHGNVGEWVQDWYGSYPTGPVVDPIGPATGSFRVFRGGSWDYGARGCRSALRLSYWPGYSGDLGMALRFVRTY